MEINRFYPIADFITLVREGKDRQVDYWIYLAAGTTSLTAETSLFIGETLGFDSNGVEVLPEPALRQNLKYGFHPEQFQDVVDLAFEQKPAASTNEVVRCLNHYAEHDCFLDLP
jgi:hypothetical protein